MFSLMRKSKEFVNEFEDVPVFGTDDLLGVQINFDDARGRVWFPFNGGLTLIYGKNGSGKTQILNSIKLALQGRSFETLAGTEPSNSLPKREVEIIVRAKPGSDYGQGLFDKLKENLFKHIQTEFYELYESDNSGSSKDASNFNDLLKSFLKIFGFEPVFIRSEWLDSEDFGSKQFSDWVGDDWLLLAKLWVFSHWISHPGDGQLNPSENQLSDESVASIKSFIHEIAEDQIVILVPIGSKDNPRWLLRLGADTLDGNSARGRIALETSRAWSEFLFDNMDPDGAIRGLFDHAEFIESTDITKSFFADGMGYGRIANSRFMSVRFYGAEESNHEVDTIPFELLDLNDLEPVLNRLLNKALESSSNFNFLTEVSEEFLETINSGVLEIREAIDESIRPIVEVGVNIEDISIQLNSTLGEIVSRQLFDLQISDSRLPNEVINYSALSDAQQRVIEIFVAIALAESRDDKLIVAIGDEIDRSLHEAAISSLYKQLQTRKLPIIAATHSFQALANTQCTKRHVATTEEGISSVSFTANDLDKSSEDFGIAKSSLLGLTQLFVVVEGEHDQIILNEILGSNGLLYGLRVQVLPMRGTVNVLRILDSRLLKYSDARVLVVADNGLNKVIGSRLALAKDLLKENSEIYQIKARILKSQTPDDSQEEKQLTHLIIDALEQNMLDRLSIFALSKGDIIEYLEISHFGLAKTWSTLRAEHKKWASQVPKGSKRDFKFFLRNEYGAKFDSKTIAGAVKSLDKIHSDLVSLVGHVRIHANLV